MKLSLFELNGEQSVLAGAIPGKNSLVKAIAQTKRCAESTPLFLDFAGVEVATASFLREGILSFRDYCRSAGTNLYPIIANGNNTVTEELQSLLEDRGDAMLTCQLDEHGTVSTATVIGVLEEKQKITLDAIKAFQFVDASTLMEKFKTTEKIGLTGWNNRLAALADKGLIMETKKGRTKYYQTVLELQ